MDGDERVRFWLWEENNLYGEDQTDSIANRCYKAGYDPEENPAFNVGTECER
jgi:hypothetical protein